MKVIRDQKEPYQMRTCTDTNCGATERKPL